MLSVHQIANDSPGRESGFVNDIDDPGGTRLVAERQGFEPWVGVHPQRFSRPPRSTTPAPLRT